VEQTFSNCCRVLEGYNVNTAHTLMGGSDILLLPGHFHPSNSLCAIAMRYGTVPIAYGSSGLEDTITDIQKDSERGTGVFFDHYGTTSLLKALDAARTLFKKPKDWKMFVGRCMEQDFSWRESARNHLLAYRRVTRRARPSK
jgi:starch synthase